MRFAKPPVREATSPGKGGVFTRRFIHSTFHLLFDLTNTNAGRPWPASTSLICGCKIAKTWSPRRRQPRGDRDAQVPLIKHIVGRDSGAGAGGLPESSGEKPEKHSQPPTCRSLSLTRTPQMLVAGTRHPRRAGVGDALAVRRRLEGWAGFQRLRGKAAFPRSAEAGGGVLERREVRARTFTQHVRGAVLPLAGAVAPCVCGLCPSQQPGTPRGSLPPR